MRQSLHSTHSLFYPGLLVMAMLAVMPLPWSTAFVSYLHPKESWMFCVSAILGIAHAGVGPLLSSKMQRTWRIVMLAFAAWLAWGVIRSGNVSHPLYMALSGLGVLVAGSMLIPFAESKVWRLRMDVAILAGGVLVALLALGQGMGVLDSLFPVNPSYTQATYSVFGNQDLLGGYLAIALVLGLTCAFRVQGQWPYFLLLFAVGVMIIPLIWSGCRTAWLALLVGAGWQLVRSRGTAGAGRSVGVVAVMALVVIAMAAYSWEAIGSRIFSLMSPEDVGRGVRVWIAEASLRMFLDHPLVGVGPGQFGWHSPRYMGEVLADGSTARVYNELWAEHPHSILLELLTEGGVVGLLIAALAAWLIFRRVSSRSRAVGPLVAMGCFGLFNDVAHSAPHGLLFFWLLACALSDSVEESTVTETTAGLNWTVLAMAGCVLAAVHAASVLIPSLALVHAEDLHLRGEGGSEEAYRIAEGYPFTHAEAAMGLAVLAMEEGRWEEALQWSDAAAKQLDVWMVHWIRGSALAALGRQEAARQSLEECLFRAPRNRAAFQRLWMLTPASERKALEAHAHRHGISLPTEAG